MRPLFIYFLFLPILGLGQTADSNYVRGQIYVKFRDSVIVPNAGSGESLNKAGELPFIQVLLGNKSITKVEKPFFTPNSERLQRIYKIELPQSESINEILQKLNQDPTVEYAERVPIRRSFYDPNDYSAYNQYSLDIIDAVHAWDITKGRTDIVVAVTDDGVDNTHEDLAANLVLGYDRARGDYNTNPDSPDAYHGTHVAGIVAAVTNNDVGLASLGFSVKVMPVKVSDGTRDEDNDLLITHGYEGINYAADHADRVRVINMSWGGGGYSQAEQDVINRAAGLGCVLVASAGNANRSTPNYPAAYANVIAVASTNSSDTRSSFSNYGSWVDLSAPGSSIYSTLLNNSYGYLSGTSMASPLVASLAALMISVNPTMTRSMVENGLKATADNINAQNPSYIGQLGAGRINAYKAVKWAETVYSVRSGSWTNGSLTTGVWAYQAPSQYTNPTIEAAHTVTVPSGTYQVKNTLTISGSLDLSTSSSILNINNN